MSYTRASVQLAGQPGTLSVGGQPRGGPLNVEESAPRLLVSQSGLSVVTANRDVSSVESSASEEPKQQPSGQLTAARLKKAGQGDIKPDHLADAKPGPAPEERNPADAKSDERDNPADSKPGHRSEHHPNVVIAEQNFVEPRSPNAYRDAYELESKDYIRLVNELKQRNRTLDSLNDNELMSLAVTSARIGPQADFELYMSAQTEAIRDQVQLRVEEIDARLEARHQRMMRSTQQQQIVSAHHVAVHFNAQAPQGAAENVDQPPEIDFQYRDQHSTQALIYQHKIDDLVSGARNVQSLTDGEIRGLLRRDESVPSGKHIPFANWLSQPGNEAASRYIMEKAKKISEAIKPNCLTKCCKSCSSKLPSCSIL